MEEGGVPTIDDNEDLIPKNEIRPQYRSGPHTEDQICSTTSSKKHWPEYKESQKIMSNVTIFIVIVKNLVSITHSYIADCVRSPGSALGRTTFDSNYSCNEISFAELESDVSPPVPRPPWIFLERIARHFELRCWWTIMFNSWHRFQKESGSGLWLSRRTSNRFLVLPSILTSFPVPADEKHLHNTVLAPPCFTVGMVFSCDELCRVSSKHSQTVQLWLRQTREPFPAF